MDWHDILEKKKSSLLRSIEVKLTMIIVGLESLQSGDIPQIVEEKLEVYIDPE